jgi:hypothetical protein
VFISFDFHNDLFVFWFKPNRRHFQNQRVQAYKMRLRIGAGL